MPSAANISPGKRPVRSGHSGQPGAAQRGRRAGWTPPRWAVMLTSALAGLLLLCGSTFAVGWALSLPWSQAGLVVTLLGLLAIAPAALVWRIRWAVRLYRGTAP